jgi:peptidoglycan lytic transglycosylase G
MVARPPVRTRRQRPTRGRLAARRLGALALLLAVAGVGIWAATSAVGGKKKPKPAPVNPTLRIVFPEGFNREQMANRITAVDEIARTKRHVDPVLSARSYLRTTRRVRVPKEFAENDKSGAPEGFLFPALYDFTAETTASELVKDQLAAFRRRWKKVDLAYAKSRNLTPYDVLIIASMVEKEVIAPKERPLVAAVIYNRLHNRMPLQIDASLRYGLHIPAGTAITQKDLDTKSPYNTTLNHGLPPTPIANPGLASMQAAAKPAKVDFLYFVRKPDKVHHFFTSSLDAFNAYVAAHPVKGA